MRRFQPTGAVNAELFARMSALEARMSAIETTHGDSTNYGIVKLSDSQSVTDSTGLAVPSSELNASVEGTVMNLIEILNSNVSKILETAFVGIDASTLVDIHNLNKFQYTMFDYGLASKIANLPINVIGSCYCIPNLSGLRLILFPYNSNAIYMKNYYSGSGWREWSVIS